MKIRKFIIKRFRSIKDQTITDINNALVLIGKNNSGKSAILTAIRLFFGHYIPKEKDFFKNCDDFEIEMQFEITDEYLSNFFLNNKLGFSKIPSSANEFDAIKEGTIFSDSNYHNFRSERNVAAQNYRNDVSTRERFEPIWINSVKNRYCIIDNLLTIKLTCSKRELRPTYIIEDNVNKDIVELFPNVAFIDDTRYFEEEESGKAKTITANLFSQVLKSQTINDENYVSCDKCNRTDCDVNCINDIRQKNPADLSIEELQKLINYKTHNNADTITSSITERFQKNYHNDFRVNIKATSNIDKSFVITTKIYDPNLDSEIELSNVGAGVRSIYILSLLQSFQAMNSNYTIFIVEEPELYLHPELQKTMANILAKIAKDCQIVFTTHSPVMLRAFCNSDIRKVRLNEEDYYSVIEMTTIDAVLNEIGYSSQDILNTDFIVFVEGPDDVKIIKLLLAKYYNVDLEKVMIIDTDSCCNIGFYATLKFLRRTTINENFAILRDLDTETIASITRTLENQLTSNIGADFIPISTTNLFITKYSSIEGYLFSPELLVSHGKFDDVDRVYTLLQEMLIRRKSKQIEYFVKHNQGDIERISNFTDCYDNMVSDTKQNIDWILKNIRGHFYFNVTQSGRLSYEEYIRGLNKEKFSDLLGFFDNISYFRDKINH